MAVGRDARYLPWGIGGFRQLNFTFHEDSLRAIAFAADVRQPTLIFQGRYDEAVDCRIVENTPQRDRT